MSHVLLVRINQIPQGEQPFEAPTKGSRASGKSPEKFQGNLGFREILRAHGKQHIRPPICRYLLSRWFSGFRVIKFMFEVSLEIISYERVVVIHMWNDLWKAVCCFGSHLTWSVQMICERCGGVSLVPRITGWTQMQISKKLAKKLLQFHLLLRSKKQSVFSCFY